MRWTCIHIGTTVDQKGNTLRGRDQRCKRRPLHTFTSAYQYLSANKNSSCTSWWNKGICLLFLNHIQTYYDWWIFFLTDRKNRGFCCLDHLGCIDNLDLVLRISGIFRQFLIYHFLFSCKNYFYVLSLCYSFHCSSDRFCRGIIPAHCVHYNSDLFCHIFISPVHLLFTHRCQNQKIFSVTDPASANCPAAKQLLQVLRFGRC